MKKITMLLVVIGLIAAYLPMVGCFGDDDDAGVATVALPGAAVNAKVKGTEVNSIYCYVLGVTTPIYATYGTDANGYINKFYCANNSTYNVLPHVFMLGYTQNSTAKLMSSLLPEVDPVTPPSLGLTPASTLATFNVLGVTTANLAGKTSIDSIATTLGSKVAAATNATVNAAAIFAAKETVKQRLGITADLDDPDAVAALTTASFKSVEVQLSVTNLTANMDALADIADATTATDFSALNIVNLNTAAVSVYPTIKVTHVNGTAVTYGTYDSTNLAYPLTGTPTFDLPNSASDATPTFSMSVEVTTANSSSLTSPLQVTITGATAKAVITISSVKWDGTKFVIPASATAAVKYYADKTGTAYSYLSLATSTNAGSNSFTATNNTFTLSLNSTMAATLYGATSGKLTNGASYTYSVKFTNVYGVITNGGTSKYNTATGTITYVAQ